MFGLGQCPSGQKEWRRTGTCLAMGDPTVNALMDRVEAGQAVNPADMTYLQGAAGVAQTKMRAGTQLTYAEARLVAQSLRHMRITGSAPRIYEAKVPSAPSAWPYVIGGVLVVGVLGTMMYYGLK